MKVILTHKSLDDGLSAGRVVMNVRQAAEESSSLCALAELGQHTRPNRQLRLLSITHALHRRHYLIYHCTVSAVSD